GGDPERPGTGGERVLVAGRAAGLAGTDPVEADLRDPDAVIGTVRELLRLRAGRQGVRGLGGRVPQRLESLHGRAQELRDPHSAVPPARDPGGARERPAVERAAGHGQEADLARVRLRVVDELPLRRDAGAAGGRSDRIVAEVPEARAE